MKTFLKGMLIFSMVIVGIVCLITVDMRSSAMAGIPPALEVYMEEVDVEEETEGYAVAYELQLIVNNKALIEKFQELQAVMKNGYLNYTRS